LERAWDLAVAGQVNERPLELVVGHRRNADALVGVPVGLD